MDRRIVLAVLTVAVVVTGGVNLAEDAAPNLAPDVSISLTPDSKEYDLESVRRGAVGFTVEIRNSGDVALTVAHPVFCVPAGYEPGTTWRREDAHGKSEILLSIRQPDGKTVVLRDGGMALFEPGFVDHLVIPPHGTASFHLGWFFENARGRWENDPAAWRVFRQKGTYRVNVVFRNAFPKAWLRDATRGRAELVDVWTGTLESAEATLTVGDAE